MTQADEGQQDEPQLPSQPGLREQRLQRTADFLADVSDRNTARRQEIARSRPQKPAVTKPEYTFEQRYRGARKTLIRGLKLFFIGTVIFSIGVGVTVATLAYSGVRFVMFLYGAVLWGGIMMIVGAVAIFFGLREMRRMKRAIRNSDQAHEAKPRIEM